jgi:hypothetical protein
MVNKAMKLHECEGTTPHADYGEAINFCVEYDDGDLWAGNGEYSSQVAYCPYCGFPARVKPVVTKL